ncbi:MAG: hypothetical protein COB39_02375 [Marinosulfonomonas sp.]|nr:MAG: hypothetical protein COB39_02375 [Marinosulfonomonas sp.]
MFPMIGKPVGISDIQQMFRFTSKMLGLFASLLLMMSFRNSRRLKTTIQVKDLKESAEFKWTKMLLSGG